MRVFRIYLLLLYPRRATFHDPIQYGDMGILILKHSVLHNQLGLHHLTQTLYWDRISAPHVLVALNSSQIVSGSGSISEVLWVLELKIDFLRRGRIPCFCKRLTGLTNKLMMFEHFWSWKPQQIDGCSLVEVITLYNTFYRRKNEACKYLQALAESILCFRIGRC